MISHPSTTGGSHTDERRGVVQGGNEPSPDPRDDPQDLAPPREPTQSAARDDRRDEPAVTKGMPFDPPQANAIDPFEPQKGLCVRWTVEHESDGNRTVWGRYGARHSEAIVLEVEGGPYATVDLQLGAARRSE